MIQVQSLSHRFADGRIALDGVSFAVAAGERVALVGPNGAGKTTLFLRLCGVLGGPRGQATIAGLDPADPGQRRKMPETVGVVFQNPDDQLFSPSIFDDVAFGPLNLGHSPDEVRASVADALNAVGLPDHAERVPHRLSGGEKRRAAIATVLSMKPSVLLLDEPSMFLDPRGRRELIELVRNWTGTILLATHDLEMVLDLCPRVLVLDGGRLAADGPAESLLADATLMETHGLEVPGRLMRR
ncbi:MAG: ABC transporter ATP-binding protein [Gemmataceae bacterium]|nr:ABC transporter ATP-binding protein [Planctomycetia bacterium]MBX3399602.1 ABC transporter ATP-binding protein [Gemmataceae bacterium]